MNGTQRAARVQPAATSGGDTAYFAVHNLHAYYGESYIVQGVSFSIK